MKKHAFLPALLLISLISICKIEKIIAQKPASVSAWPRGITYEIFVLAFADSDGDGKGDIKGMTSKLDYLRDLGVEGIWLMPMHPSPSYHKYDVSDYYNIHPDYGTLDDFRKFIEEAHKRNIKVIMDMVINHSGRQHSWFKDAITNPNSPYREYYVFTHKDDPQTQIAARTGPDSGNRNRWSKIDSSDYLYYSHFSRNMPDLNFDSYKLREEVFKIGRFWISEMKVDGFRLDAARHIFPDERSKDNHRWWIYFRNEMLKANKNVYLVGEVWAPAEVVGPYMQGLPALFNFEMGGAIIKAVNAERGDSLAVMHKRIRDFYKSINPDYIDATFLTNHDQNRIMSAVNNNTDKARMAASVLLTLPGSPYLYYGEEIGMHGMKPDQHIREPFLWDVKAKDKLRTTWIVPKYTADSSVIPVAQQINDKSSILNHYKTFIQLRNSSKALTYGELEPVNLDNKELCAFVRSTNDESVLVLHNLSRADITVNLSASLGEYDKLMFKNKTATVKNKTVLIPSYSTVILLK
jgi:alpha-amylase